MKGSIYKTKYGWQVRFGRKIGRHFTEKIAAERFLTGLRFKTDEGSFDIRDYSRDNPLGFKNQAVKWLKTKRLITKPKHYANLNRYMQEAIKEWGNINIKIIAEAEIEDFLFKRTDISEKTRSMMKSCLHDFWSWVIRREKRKSKIDMPEFPDISFELGWRNIIDIETQQRIIDKVRQISYHINPKIWLGIRWLATYISCRPKELLGLEEKNIRTNPGVLIIPYSKEKKPKLVYLLQEDIDFLKSIPRGLPDMYFFRHPPGLKGARAGSRFGNRYLYKYWKKACVELGIEGVDLYGGTRHSTTTALGQICTPEQVRDASGHSSKAFERYFQNRQARALKITEKIKGLRGEVIKIDDSKTIKSI